MSRQEKKDPLIVTQFCVRFFRRDNADPPVEDYFYWEREDAEFHFSQFKGVDDPDFPKMYEKIQLISIYNHLHVVSDEIVFPSVE